MNSEATIQAGFGSRSIEAERLVTKVATISREAHGPAHKTTLRQINFLRVFRLNALRKSRQSKKSHPNHHHHTPINYYNEVLYD